MMAPDMLKVAKDSTSVPSFVTLTTIKDHDKPNKALHFRESTGAGKNKSGLARKANARRPLPAREKT
jgi:hypothetical protein